ncbi:MAG: TlpA disulfide reductase family protein [Acidobacteriota bacterium]
MKKASLVTLLITVIVLVVVALYNTTKTQQSISDLAKAPNFTLPDANGRRISLEDFRGKVVILNFWATWCSPCRVEIPAFIQLYNTYKDRGLEIIGVSLDKGGWDDVKPFIKEYKINYHIVLDDGETANSYGGIIGIPTTFIIDKNGSIIKKYVGYPGKEVFEAEIRKLS